MTNPLAALAKDMVPTMVFEGHTWYEIRPEVVYAALRQRVSALEASKMNAVVELAEARSVYAEAPDIHPGKNSNVAVNAVDLAKHIGNLEAQVTEYDLRIAALFRLAGGLPQPQFAEPPSEEGGATAH